MDSMDGAVPLDGHMQGGYPRPALPPPLPPIVSPNTRQQQQQQQLQQQQQQQQQQNRQSRPTSSAPHQHDVVVEDDSADRRRTGSSRRQQPNTQSVSVLPPSPETSRVRTPRTAGSNSHNNNNNSRRAETPGSAHARSVNEHNNTNNSTISRPVPSHTPNASVHRHQHPLSPSSASPSRLHQGDSRTVTPSKNRESSQSMLRRASSQRSSRAGTPAREDGAEELMPIALSHTRPVEKFFIECQEATVNRGAESSRNLDIAGQPRNEEEMLLEQFAEYTDDDSFFSSGSTVIECDPRRMAVDPMRGRAVKSVHETLQLRQLTNGRVPEDTVWQEAAQTSWLYQVHYRALALEHSSFFVFPARWTPRVMVYNVMHHWLFEVVLFFVIFSYGIFQATWVRHTAKVGDMVKPDQMIFADVFYTVLLGFEVVFRLFATGLVLHPRAFLRSPWHWLDTAVLVLMIMACTGWQQLWNFTTWRLIRCIKCLTYVPAPVRMKLLAKSLLRSTNQLTQVSIVLLYFIFFFGLLGLQLFVGELRSRCVMNLTGRVTDQICRPESSGKYWFYWGHHCERGYTCVQDAFPNPHFDFQNFDDIGHALLSTFQIMTFQGWTSLMNETSDGLAVMAFLYYVFTILLCTWVVPSLFLGVFLEKIEKTTRQFILKQLNLFDSMLLEQRQRMSATVRLHDFVERDENGCVAHYPSLAPKQALESSETSSNSQNQHSKASAQRPIKRMQWTDEQRVQLALSLTRQRGVAEDAERKRRDAMLSHKGAKENGSAMDVTQQHNSQQSLNDVEQTAENFALGGRVGRVQHHPAEHSIGTSQQTDVPFAVRQEMTADELKFLGNAVSPARGANLERSPSHRTNQSQTSFSRPPLGMSVSAMRETAGVVPNKQQHDASMRVNQSMMLNNTMSQSRLHASMMQDPHQQEEAKYIVNDPEGGDFEHAETCTDYFDIIRNIMHMFTEGYPRILTQYLWEHRMMQYRYGLLPLTYTNKYEEAALRKLRRRRLRERMEEREELRRHGLAIPANDSELDEDEPNQEARWVQEEGLVAGSMSPIRMARNIKENAPVTVFNCIVYFLIFANAVFNASRYDTMPDYWEQGTFIAGVCFSSIFVLELLIRLVALGPGPFFLDFFNMIEATCVVLSLFQLGFSRANTISLFNWIRFLKLFRVMPIRPLRRVTRVLLHGFPDMLYALVFFSLYMFMWLLLGMSFFGSRLGSINYANSDYSTRASFESFSFAAYAIAQAFSVNRDQWLYLSWSGMRVRGGYTIMYFIATVLIAFILRFFFIATMAWAWQSQDEQEDYGEAVRQKGSRHPKLPWFDFTVWRSFKHIHGGFERRDVAPDEVYFLNEDMRRQLRLVEAKDKHYRNVVSEFADRPDYLEQRNHPHHQAAPVELQYVNIGGQIYRQQALPRDNSLAGAEPLYGNNAQLRFAREMHAVPATTYHVPDDSSFSPRSGRDEYEGGYNQQNQSTMSASPQPAAHPSQSVYSEGRSILNPLMSTRHSLAPGRSVSQRAEKRNAPSVRGGDPVESNGSPSVAAQLLKLGRANGENNGVSGEEAGGGPETYEHLLLPGPRLRYKSTIVDNSRRVFECCLDCNVHLQMPLRAPHLVAQRTADELHAEHCHMAAVRSSRQLVLNALIGYAHLQYEHEVRPTKRMVETVLGQAWSCGLLLYETIESLSCSDLPEEQRNWTRMLQALELQQWLLGLHVGEEQVGRATLAYVLAHQQRQERATQETHYSESWQEHSFLILAPSNPVRKAITAVVDSWWFEVIMLCVIYAASICLAVYTPGNDNEDMGGYYNSNKYKALHVLDDIFTVIFVVEMVLKWISMGVILPVGRAYFWHLWNIFDCFIVIISLVSWADDKVYLRYLKVMRCFRILGPLRYFTWNANMMQVARCIWDSIPTLANVCLIMLMNYIVWAILFVSMFMNKMSHCDGTSPAGSPITSKDACLQAGFGWIPTQRNFQNFYESLLTTFEISTGAEWMDVMYNAVDSWSTSHAPITNRHQYLGLVFIAYYYVSHFVLFSLFIATVVYCYMVTKNQTSEEEGNSFEHQLWLRMQEMVLRLKPDIRLLPLNNAFSRGLHCLVHNRFFESFMGLILTFNMITMALQWYGMNSKQGDALDILQYIFVAIFTVEVILRLVAHGPRFFTRWAYCWDLLIVCLSFIQIGLNTTNNHRVPFNVNVLRMLRFGRFLSLVNLVTPFNTYFSLFHEVLLLSVPGIINVSLVYMLAVYVFAILGLHFLGYIVPYGGYIDGKYNNFMTFVNSLIMVFRLSTLENWVAMLRGSLDRGNYCDKANGRCGPTDWAPVYYIPIVICFFLLLSSLYMAVIVDHYVIAIRMRSSVARLHDLYRFRRMWSARDPNATLFLPTTELIEILQELRLPLGLSSRHNRVELMRLLREYDIDDHDGQVYYYEVLFPLARRAMAMAFHEDHDEGASSSYDVAWRQSENTLRAPAALRFQHDSRGAASGRRHTVAEYYATTYMQAAYRRDKAMRNYYIAKSGQWRAGRAACDELGLPYDSYGFGNVGLAYADPREEGLRKGFSVPEGASAAQSPVYRDAVNERLQQRMQQKKADAQARGSPATILPAMYESAIHETEKRFGPDTSSAIKRHERRSDKLERRRAQEDNARSASELQDGYRSTTAEQLHESAMLGRSASQQIELGTSVSANDMSAMRSRSMVAPAPRYNVDPNSSSYQPPLGTHPEDMREEELQRRHLQKGTAGSRSPSAAPR